MESEINISRYPAGMGHYVRCPYSFWLHILTRVINRHAPFEYIVLERRYIHTYIYIYMHIFILQNRHCPVSSTNLNNLTCILEW